MTIGRLVTPTLKIVREIGAGGMGKVWAAEHLTLQSLVAVKMMARGYIDDEKSITRFKQEAQRAARVKSPHVAIVFDHGVTAADEPYIVMELLEGETLGERIKRNGALPLDEVEKLIGQTAKALAAAHKLNVVHRDIKPANLFIVDNEGEPFVKVLDFGIAKQMDVPPDLTSSSVMIGSPPYMSPEQYMSPKTVDLRTDLWALGVVAYEALTGVKPFGGETPMGMALQITRGRFRPPSEVRADLPKALDAWMKKALAVEPEKRFGTAMEMVEAFGNAIQSGLIVKKLTSKTRTNNPPRFATTASTPQWPTDQSEYEKTTPIDANKFLPRARFSTADFRPFEGAWFSAPMGGHYYVRAVRSRLHVAYCRHGNDELSGEYYDCHIVSNSFFARFRWPLMPNIKGYVTMHATSLDTLVGGWWSESDVPANIAADLSKLNPSIPGMNAAVWRRLPPIGRFPDWAERHFAMIEAATDSVF